MTQQKRDHRTKVQGHRKGAVTRRVEHDGGASAVTVNEQVLQLRLPLGTAANPQGPVVGAEKNQLKSAPHAGPKPRFKGRSATSATMEKVCERLAQAFEQVASNQGAPGPDRQSIGQVREYWSELEPRLKRSLEEGSYRPGDIRRVWIPKANGGQRGLGIPNVVDRVVQEAIREVLEPLYEPTFHKASHGFRPGRSCQTAIRAAYEYIEAGYDWVVDLDLEKFFDQVNHQRLLGRLSQRVEEKSLLCLIGKLLKAKVVMPNGVVVSTEEGVPQGGPLSPLLSNIVLDELDQELSRRGHRFVRYADDCNIYVRSARAGERVKASLTTFIERRLRLHVNESKSAVARPEERHFLGFRLMRKELDGSVEVLLSRRSKQRIDVRIRELTPRNWGQSLRKCIAQANEYLEGWIGFFGICTPDVEVELKALDAHLRRRLRAIQLAHWKRKRTIVRKLTGLGVHRKTAWRRVYAGRKSLWALSQDWVAHQGLRNAYFAARGLVSLVQRWHELGKYIGAPGEQLLLPLG